MRLMLARRYRGVRRGVRMLCVVLFGKRQAHGQVTACGDDAFVRAIVDALDILKAKTPDAYALLEKHLVTIVCVKPSGVFTKGLSSRSRTVVGMGPGWSKGSIVEYAGALAHEAYHCELYRCAEQSTPGRSVPRDAYSGEHAESLCLKYQCDVLRRLGLDEERVHFWERRFESRWWEIPFDQRTW